MVDVSKSSEKCLKCLLDAEIKIFRVLLRSRQWENGQRVNNVYENIRTSNNYQPGRFRGRESPSSHKK